MPWRLIQDPPASGDWNMAVDQLLLEQAAAGAAPCLRLYRWDRPTLSLGYFQPLEEVPPEARRRRDVVRRPTGGGAILHDRELTYAAAVDRGRFDGAQLYERINGAILFALHRLGIDAEIRGGSGAPGPARAQRGPFFCFARAGATDIIARSLKLAGSAQRRRPRGILQHGSVLLETEEPGAIGASAALARPVGFDEMAAAMVRGFEREFGAVFEERSLSPDERQRVEQIRRRRYGNRRWLQRGDRKGPS
jgi:lipoate-protein ligase A